MQAKQGAEGDAGIEIGLQGTQGTQQQQGGATAPAMNTQIQPTPVQPS